MARRAMLTTVDNPHSPFDDFRAWHSFDTRVGHNTAAFLGRVVAVSNELSESDYNLAIESEIDRLVKSNITGLYKKVVKED